MNKATFQHPYYTSQSIMSIKMQKYLILDVGMEAYYITLCGMVIIVFMV